MQTIKNKFIAVEGVIGVGKTTLAKRLAKELNSKLICEVVEENPFLHKFYDDIKGRAFQTQIFFLLSRYRQMKKFFQIEMFQTNIVSDYMFMKDSIFANLTLNQDELRMYQAIFSILKEKVVHPDLIIYLYADLEKVLHRIKSRNRTFERNIQPEYINNLMKAYDNFFTTFTDCKVIKIDTNNINYSRYTKQFDKLVITIKKMFQI
ncbi:MAG: deoxynucleoside kinase [Candidatus Cloacimonetes bacterium]|nr:deoxynucleoside kinase [Candidatus Cloacimonadota bacterium]